MNTVTTTLALFLIFASTLSTAQLNFDGNPLIDNTDYTAEESRSVERNAKQKTQDLTKSAHPERVSQQYYPVYAKDSKNDKRDYFLNASSLEIHKSIDLTPIQINTKPLQPRNLQFDSYKMENEKNEVFTQHPHHQSRAQQQTPLSNYALDSFLNSKTPEESRLALDYFLTGHPVSMDLQKGQNQIKQTGRLNQTPNEIILQGNFPPQNNFQIPQNFQLQSNFQAQKDIQPQQHDNIQFPQSPRIHLQRQQHQVLPQQKHVQLPLHATQPQQNMQISTEHQNQPQPNFPDQQQSQYHSNYLQTHNVNISHNPPLQVQAYSPEPMTIMNAQPSIHFQKFMPIVTRFSRHQGRPIMERFQSKPIMQRIGPPVVYKSPSPVVAFAPPVYPPPPPKFKPPVEIIYTKPSGFTRGPPPHVASPSTPYEGTGPWFSDTEYPPPSKDIYYSQLYAQSYDPHYYNYIAKTGKIKPHLYGKLHEHPPEDEGIWMEMLRGFKKHGLKNIMNPTFLLGMTIPALTLMLTALVQKRSLARADFGLPTIDEERLNEYTMRLQKALQSNDKRDKSVKRISNNRRR